MALIEHQPTGLLKHLLRAPIWFYRAGLGRLLGHRFVYIAHRGRRTGARREVVLEVVGYTARIPEVVVIAAWGENPDWYRNLKAAPAMELRIAAQRSPTLGSPQPQVPGPRRHAAGATRHHKAHPRACSGSRHSSDCPLSSTRPRFMQCTGVVFIQRAADT